MTRAEVVKLYGMLAKAMPEPRSELEFRDPYQLLVAVILSAQATDRSVNRVTESLFREAPTPESMLALGEGRLRKRIREIGLANGKARNIVATSRALLERHGGTVPAERAALEALPGVGRKTANVVLNVAFGQPTVAVDTHVFRVANRTGLAPGKDVREVEERLLAATPKRFLQHAHHYLILHGRYVCKARKPECPACPIAEVCAFPDKVAEKDAAPARPAKARPATVPPVTAALKGSRRSRGGQGKRST